MTAIATTDAIILTALGYAGRADVTVDRNPNRPEELPLILEATEDGDIILGAVGVDSGSPYLACTRCQGGIDKVDAGMCVGCREDLAFQEAEDLAFQEAIAGDPA